MSDNIKIRAGTGLQAVLQSTINFPQAFTELAKNSLQNGATVCNIDVTDDMIKVSDNGNGFNHVKDTESDMSDFEKYFVFGNSYDLNMGDGPKLGRMGIGGKISNDKLSEPNDSHWQIYTKNKHGKCFVIDYDPPAHVEFLEEYAPTIKEISQVECPVKTSTGTEVRILKVNKNFLKTDHKVNVKNELLAFFAHLVVSYQKDKKIIDIVLNGKKLEFSIDMAGNYRGMIKRAFQYELGGEKKWSSFEIALNQFAGRRIRKQKRQSSIKSLELVSEVKICDLHITDGVLIEKTLAKLSEEEGDEIEDAAFLGIMGNFIGYVNCMDLSKVLDERGMPAKDLSHHGLRSDHPITIPFLEEVYYVIMKLMYHISKLSQRRVKRSGLNKNLVAYNVAKLLANDFTQDMEILTDKKMLGLDKVEKIDKSLSDEDLILEKLLGDSKPPPPPEPIPSTNKPLVTRMVSSIQRFFTPSKHPADKAGDAVMRYKTPVSEKPFHDTKESTELHETPLLGEFTEVSEEVSGVEQHSTKLGVDDYRELLKKRTSLRKEIAELKQILTTKDGSAEHAEELAELTLELEELVGVLGKIRLFYMIEHMDDEMVISEVRERRGGFVIVINENNIRYRSIKSDLMLLALHVAEAMIKEIIFMEDEEIDKGRLDRELSLFYERHYNTLQGNDLLSM